MKKINENVIGMFASMAMAGVSGYALGKSIRIGDRPKAISNAIAIGLFIFSSAAYAIAWAAESRQEVPEFKVPEPPMDFGPIGNFAAYGTETEL